MSFFKFNQVLTFGFAAVCFVSLGTLPGTVSAQSGLEIITGPAKKPETAKKKSRNSLSAALQSELNRMGCKAGAADGQWGGQSQAALDRAAARAPSLAGKKRSKAMLKEMQSLPAGLCTLTCKSNETIVNGSCVTNACKSGQIVSQDGVCTDAVMATVGETLKSINDATGLYDPNKFDGTWVITTKGSKKCTTPSNTFTVTIKGRNVSGKTKAGRTRTGRITLAGNLDIRGPTESGDGKTTRLTGKFKKSSGQGTMKVGNGRPCRGKFAAVKQ